MLNKKINYLLVIIFSIFLFPMYIFASGSISVNKSSINIEEGKTTTFKITATNASGKVTISTDDSEIASVDKTSENIDNETLKVTVTGNRIGTTKITVEFVDFVSTDGDELSGSKTIDVKVTGPKSSVNNLTALKINGVSVTGFSSSKTSYEYSTENSSIEISAEKEDPNSTVSGTGTKKVSFGSNKYSIKVTAENGNVKTYTLIVNRKDTRDTNNNLKDIKIDGVVLSGFVSTKTDYTITSEASSVNITATTDSTLAKVSGTGTKTIKEGSNKFSIKVTAENEETKTYTLTINKGKVEETKKDDTKVTYTLEYDEDSLQYCPKGTIATITTDENQPWGKLCEAKREGYVFNGWYTKEIGGTLINETVLAVEDIKAYAHWSEEIVKKATECNCSASSKIKSSILILTGILSFALGVVLTFMFGKKFIKNED